LAKLPTIGDIAREANVSSVTVSRVINTPALVKRATRERVERAIDKLGYTPNLAARTMRTRATRTVGFLVPDILSYSNAAVAQAADQVLAKAGYGMMLVSCGYDRTDGLRALEMLRAYRVDGVLIYLGNEDDSEIIARLTGLDRPSVVIDRDLPIDTDTVLSEHRKAIRETVRYLVSLGHRSLTFVVSDLRIRPALERRMAFTDAIRAEQLDPESQDILLFPRPGSPPRDLTSLFNGPSHPTAIIAAGSRCLTSIIENIRSLGLKVPDDVSLVGIDVEDVASVVTPELTRISRDYGAIGQNAARFLLERLTHPERDRQSALLHSDLVLKDSCARPPLDIN
jgi:LacI family transcriptional regulator